MPASQSRGGPMRCFVSETPPPCHVPPMPMRSAASPFRATHGITGPTDAPSDVVTAPAGPMLRSLCSRRDLTRTPAAPHPLPPLGPPTGRRAVAPVGRGGAARVPVRHKWRARVRPADRHRLFCQRGGDCRTACCGSLGARPSGGDQRKLDDERAHRGGHGRHGRGGRATPGGRAAHRADAQSGRDDPRQLQMRDGGRRLEQAVAGAILRSQAYRRAVSLTCWPATRWLRPLLDPRFLP